MKKLLCAALSVLILICSVTLTVSAVTTSAESAVVISGDGVTVYEKNANVKRGMASTTKIMTAIVAIENCPPDRVVKIADSAIGVEGSSIYLKKGESLTMEQLLYALLLQSANDAAAAIAFEVGGSIEGFASMMNEKAKKLGLCNTHFTNPHGLYDDDHYTTAYDLAAITRYALENELFRTIVGTVKTTIPLNDGNGKRALVNHNKLLIRYDGAIGVKTGFTKKTGRCLVSAAERDGTRLIAVTLNAPDDWNDHTAMLNDGFEKIQTFHLISPNGISFKLPVTGGMSPYVSVSNKGGLSFTCKKNGANITYEVRTDRFLFAPVKAGDRVGQIVFYNNNEEIGRVDLFAESDVARKATNKKLFGLF